MGYLTKQWSPVDQAQLESKQREMQQLSQEISAYRRKRVGKAGKPQIQFLSKKDTRKKPSRVMWIRRKTKARKKSRLAKLKHRYAGMPHVSEFPERMRFESTTQTHVPAFQHDQSEEEMLGTARAADRYMDPHVYEGAYRRKLSKKKNKKLAKQKHTRTLVYDGGRPMSEAELEAIREREEAITKRLRQASLLASAGVDTVYRRKHLKKKNKKKRKK
jgi:hypothetical protein